MPKYLVEGSYADQGTADLIANPEDCVAAVRFAAEALGGSVELLYFAFGDVDVVAIFDMPDDVSMTALSMAASSGGALKSLKTTVLMTNEDGMEAMRQAGESD